jgi:hypothetical protein
MAVTVQSQPLTYNPVYNPQWFVATSTQTAQPNFRYTVVLTDLLSSETVTYSPDANPNGTLQLDVSAFSKQYMTQVNPNGLYGFQKNTGALRKIRVNIGETYDVVGVPTYFAGSNIEYLVWNGALDFLEMQSFAIANYVYAQSGNNVRMITNNRNPSYITTPSPGMAYVSQPERTATNRSNYIYCLSTTYRDSGPGVLGDFQYITVVGYNAVGSEVARTKLLNTYSASSDYTNRYVFIDVGAKGLANMPGALVVSGTYPIPVTTYAYWDVFDSSDWIPFTGVPADPNFFPLKRIHQYCEPLYDVNAVHYLSPEGAFDTAVCSKLSLRSLDGTKSYYSKIPYVLTGYNVGYNYDASVERTLNSSTREKITVNTDWLEEYEVTALKDVIAAPIVFVDLGLTGGFVSMKVNNNSYQEKRKYNEKLISVSFDLEYTHTNVRQNG